MTLTGRRVLITGGGTGVGADLARGFAAAGAEVVVAGRRMEPLEGVAGPIGARAIAADVTDEAGVAALFAEAGPVEIALADTIGVANPAHVARLVERVRQAVQPLPVRVHFHNTRNTGLANVWAAVVAGATIVDASLGGLGGCPFAPGAAGNVPSEDVVYMLERAGVRTGMALDKLIEASNWLSGVMERKLPGMVAQAPHFPKAA